MPGGLEAAGQCGLVRFVTNGVDRAEDSYDDLSMEVTAKTYRYIDEGAE